jgi:hypothetical protein
MNFKNVYKLDAFTKVMHSNPLQSNKLAVVEIASAVVSVVDLITPILATPLPRRFCIALVAIHYFFRWHKPARRESPIQGIDQKSLITTDRPRHLDFLIALTMLVIFIVDITFSRDGLLEFFKNPISTIVFDSFQGTDDGYTLNTSNNALKNIAIKNINPTVSQIEYDTFGFLGPHATATLKQIKSRVDIQLKKFIIQVTRFESISPFITTGHAAGFSEALEVSFAIRKLKKHLPWEFESNLRRSTADGRAIISDFGFDMPKDKPLELRYYVAAIDPGIYWCKFFVDVSVNNETPFQRIKLNSNPTPLAFYEDGGETNASESLESILHKLGATTIDQVIRVPINTSNEDF